MTQTTQTTITCPQCGKQSEAAMPLNACQMILDCPHCGARLKRTADTCCVFCAHGENPCKPNSSIGC